MTKEELDKVLEDHMHWLREDCDGWETMRANLRGANLRGADLRGADLRGADLYRANLYGAKNVPLIPYACPDFGMFIGWKAAESEGGDKVIVQLEIPEDAKRTSATSRKCRCDKAKVLNIKSIDGKTEYTEAHSGYDKSFMYRPGETVTPTKPFNENRWDECSSGIHFFINRQEAVDY